MAIIRTMRHFRSYNENLRKVIKLTEETVLWLTGFTEFKIQFDPYGKSKACKMMVHTPNRPPLTVAFHRNRHKEILEKVKQKRLVRKVAHASVVVVVDSMLSPIQSAATPSDPSTMEGHVAVEEHTVVSVDSTSDANTVASSSVASAELAPSVPKRAKASAKPKAKAVAKSKGRGKGDGVPTALRIFPRSPREG